MSDETVRRTDDGTATDTTAVDDSLVRVPEAGQRPSEGLDVNERIDLLDEERSGSLRRRWEKIQAGFVDRPRESVEEADRLVLELVEELQAAFGQARKRLESQWDRGDDASTEDLRLALRRYRSFFDRLLAA
jgi:hypothetical protein